MMIMSYENSYRDQTFMETVMKMCLYERKIKESNSSYVDLHNNLHFDLTTPDHEIYFHRITSQEDI